MKEICGICKEKISVWYYMPKTDSKENHFYCDDCVHRGCSCNHRHVDEDSYYPPLENKDLPTIEDEPFKWIEEGKIWCSVDEKGREYPCCEYWYDEDGWDIE